MRSRSRSSRAFEWPSSASTALAPTRLLRDGVQDGGRSGRGGGGGRRHDRHREPGGGRRSRRPNGEWFGADVPIHFHGHNDFGLATAAAVAAVRAGASWIQGTVNGMGERAGNANLPEIALALRALYGVETNLRLDRARGVLGAAPRSLGLRARAVEAGRRREPLPPRDRERWPASSMTRRRSSRTPPSSSPPKRSDRARQEERASTRSGSRPKSSGSISPTTNSAELLAARQGAGHEKARARHGRRVSRARTWLSTTRSSSAAE